MVNINLSIIQVPSLRKVFFLFSEDQKGLLQILETLSKVALLSQANKSKLVANKAKAEEPFKQAKEGEISHRNDVVVTEF